MTKTIRCSACDQSEHQERRLFSIGRRQAVQRIAAIAAGFGAAVRSAFGQKRLAISLDKAEKLKTVGGSALLKVQEKEILFIRDGETSVRAINPVCTHKKCMVEYKHDAKRIVCPCHGSNFDLDGRTLKGPAGNNLQVYDASLDLEKGRIVFALD